MAEVTVSTWAELTAAVNNATVSTTINLDSDIDVNNEYQTGISVPFTPRNNIQITIKGYNHKIKNLTTAYKSGGVQILCGTNSYKMWIYDVAFENVLLQYPGDAFINRYVSLVRCDVSIELAKSTSFTYSNYSYNSFYRCGINITSIDETKLAENQATDSEPDVYELCNIVLNGKFTYIYMKLISSYLSGDIKKIGIGRYKFTGYNSSPSINSIINATIDMSEADPGDNGRWILGNSSIVNVTINSETFNGGEGGGINSNYTQVSTADLKNPQMLRDDYGLPITPLVGE